MSEIIKQKLTKESDISSPYNSVSSVRFLFYIFAFCGLIGALLGMGAFMVDNALSMWSWLSLLIGLIVAVQYFFFAELLSILQSTHVNTMKLLHRIDMRPHDLPESANPTKLPTDTEQPNAASTIEQPTAHAPQPEVKRIVPE